MRMADLSFPKRFKFKTRTTNWTDEEIMILLKAWKDNHYMKHSMKKFQNKTPLHTAIANEIQSCGYHRTVLETAIKMKNLLKNYRTEKATVAETGALASTWRFYDSVEEIVLMDEELEKSRAASKAVTDHSTSGTRRDSDDHEETTSSTANIIKLSVPSGATDYESDAQCPPEENHFVPKVPSQGPRKVILVNNGQVSPRRNSESILLSFFKEFKRANHQLERNDSVMLQLFKENNEIFKQQNELISMLLRK